MTIEIQVELLRVAMFWAWPGPFIHLFTRWRYWTAVL